MKLGLYLSTQFDEGTNVAAALPELVEQVRTARSSGFSSLWAPHHYATYPVQMLAPVPTLSYLAPVAEGMTIGVNILVMPLLNPLHVAEDAATLDLLSGGRHTIGMGIGYREAEFNAFNVPLKSRVSRLSESVAILRRLWSEERITYQGEVFRIDDLGIGLRPLQAGGPPIWIGGVVDAAVKRAARIGDAWLITNFAHLDVLAPQMRMYRAALAELGKPFPADVPITRECYVCASRARALEECRGPLQYKYDAYASWGLDKQSASAESFEQPFEQFVKDRCIIGDKVFVKEEVERYREVLGVNHFIMRVQWPGLGQDKVLHTIRSLGEIFA